MNAPQIADALIKTAQSEAESFAELRKALAKHMGGDAQDFFNMTAADLVSSMGMMTIGELLALAVKHGDK